MLNVVYLPNGLFDQILYWQTLTFLVIELNEINVLCQCIILLGFLCGLSIGILSSLPYERSEPVPHCRALLAGVDLGGCTYLPMLVVPALLMVTATKINNWLVPRKPSNKLPQYFYNLLWSRIFYYYQVDFWRDDELSLSSFRWNSDAWMNNFFHEMKKIFLNGQIRADFSSIFLALPFSRIGSKYFSETMDVKDGMGSKLQVSAFGSDHSTICTTSTRLGTITTILNTQANIEHAKIKVLFTTFVTAKVFSLQRERERGKNGTEQQKRVLLINFSINLRRTSF